MAIILTDPTDDELEDTILRFARTHAVTMLKAPIVAAMGFLAILILTGSIWKALAIAAICLALSAFNTWRRLLEPLVFWCLVGAVAYWCDPDIVSHLKSFAN